MNPKAILNGISGGLAGGLVFGMMMGMMGMLPMIGKMVGYPSAVVGFAVHMLISGGIGAGFAVIFSRVADGFKKSSGYGLVYGAIWWVMGPLTFMPLMMGMGLGVNWNLTAMTNMMPSLMGHLIYGFLLGATYNFLARWQVAAAPLPAPSLSAVDKA